MPKYNLSICSNCTMCDVQLEIRLLFFTVFYQGYGLHLKL